MGIKDTVIKLTGKVPFGLRTRIKNIPGLKQLQAALLRKWINDDEFTATITGGPAKGLVFPVQMPQDKLMWIGTWELDYAKALAGNVRPGWICYDIGGYKGYYAGIMALKGAKEVFVFEPMSANAEKIMKLLELNPILPIKLMPLAVSDRSGEAVFNVMPEETMGKLAGSSFQQMEKGDTQVTVKTASLDELIKGGMPEPDFMKIDVEGAEELVLMGAKNLLQKKKPLLMIEIHSPEIGKRCLSILEKYYPTVRVFETGKSPLEGTPGICHYIAKG